MFKQVFALHVLCSYLLFWFFMFGSRFRPPFAIVYLGHSIPWKSFYFQILFACDKITMNTPSATLSQPHFEGVWGWHSHSRNGDLGVLRESSGTPENSELDFRGQNTSPWSVLHTDGKVLKRGCRKWPCMSHSDIWSISYVRKKGRESKWQFDSRPLKVGNRPNSLACRKCANTIGKLLTRATTLL